LTADRSKNPEVEADVIRLGDVKVRDVEKLLNHYSLRLVKVAEAEPIPGSYWGEPEAGLCGNLVYARCDTPMHSLLHETSHVICMTGARRAALHRDAGGDDLEEAAVCYMQIILADEIPGLGRDCLMRDMDAWGYSFRLGSTARWFASDADDALSFLQTHDLIAENGTPTWSFR